MKCDKCNGKLFATPSGLTCESMRCGIVAYANFDRPIPGHGLYVPDDMRQAERRFKFPVVDGRTGIAIGKDLRKALKAGA